MRGLAAARRAAAARPIRRRPGAERLFAALVAASAWAGLSLSYALTLGDAGSAAAAAWVMLRYFSFWIDLVVALAFTALAARPRRLSPAAMGGIALNASLMAAVYGLLLSGLYGQTVEERLADLFLHRETPALVLVFWLLCVPRGGLRYGDVGWWSALPLFYFAATLARGSADGVYPYPFLDVGRIGWGGTALYAAAIAGGFLAAGLGLVRLDRALGAMRPPADGAGERVVGPREV